MLSAGVIVAGVEIGSRGRRVALATSDGQVLATRSSPEAPSTPSVVLTQIVDMVRECLTQVGLSEDNLARVGCGFGAPVDAASGIVLPSRRLPSWENIPLASLIEEQLGAPCLVDNNARIAALGETRSGAARGQRHTIYIHLGSGLGGGIIIDGRLYHGATTTAGEIGHLVMTEAGPLCSCGRPGHLEAYASGHAIVQRALALTRQQAPGGPLLGLIGADTPNPNHVFEAARMGDPAARAIVDEAVHFLGIALANLISAFNPGIVVVGGSVAAVGPLLFDPLGAVVRRYVMAGPARATRIVPARLGDEAVISGAIALALQSLDWA